MGDFASFRSETPREPRWFERDVRAALADHGLVDVLKAPDETPDEFWEVVVQLSHYYLISSSDGWTAWQDEMQWMTGWPKFEGRDRSVAYAQIVRYGQAPFATGIQSVSLGVRLGAIETLMDVGNWECEDFESRVNDRARWFRVGLAIKDKRFLPVTATHAHAELVTPTLLLLSDAALDEVDELYRKAFDRVLSGDPAGAITAASSAIETMLRIGLDGASGNLESLVGKARAAGWLSPSVASMIPKVMALRGESDAHTAGTDDFDIGMFAVHLAATILLYVSKTAPFSS